MPMISRRGFTLLEAMIALSLGVVILLITYSGFRVAAASMTATERRALENQLLITGTMIALDQADLWTDLDVASDPSQQGLRTNPSKTLNPLSNPYAADASDWQQLPQPFTGLNESWPLATAVDFFDPDGWHPHNERSWYRGDGGLFLASGADYVDESAYGNYAIGSAAGSSVQPLTGHTTSVSPTSTWYASQHEGLKYGLGFYGWFDYLPAHAMMDYYSIHSNQRALRPVELRRLHRMRESEWGGPSMAIVSDDAMFVWDVNPQWHGRIAEQTFWPHGGSWVANGIPTLNRSGAERVVSRGSYLRDTHMAISGPVPGESAVSDRRRASLNRMIIGTYGHGWEPMSALTAVIQSANRERRIIQDPPEDWPTVQVGMRRIMHMGNVTSYAFVRLVDPISGVSEELFLPVLSTSLRGARMNRGLDP
ncbi:MAG: prepilin-type N-terminal cleavage/methylation domain-containing protein [Planctomycetota bacterium]|nr:MAG: prepilin-type N-terminal cleavage/methylation domain-containing protein [Planctomycetota bacterium]